MLTEEELRQASTQLANHVKASEQNHAALKELTTKYAALIADYSRLKSDYEEERDARERYKQMARGQERNPFVLVLVDGDGYVFKDELVKGDAEGGQRAAQLLDRVIKNSLQEKGLDDCRVMVRVYANLVGLSKSLSHAKLVGPHKRSLAPFAANFTRSNDLYDFTDAGELKENADFKVKAMFRQFADNAQCRHIYFAGCHDVGYINDLVPYSGSQDRVTLVRHHAFHPEFNKLNIPIEDFRGVFRTTPLDGAGLSSPHPASTIPTGPGASANQAPKICSFYQKGECKLGDSCRNLHIKASNGNEQPVSPSVQPGQKVCFFFQRGKCTYGNACRNLHIRPNGNGAVDFQSSFGTLEEIRDWRQGASNGTPFKAQGLAQSDTNFMRGVPDPIQSRIDIATLLPPASSIPIGQVAVNKQDQRIDPYIPIASPEDHKAFQERVARQKLCNTYHLTGVCRNGSCEYDHNPITSEMQHCLEYHARNLPCTKRGACRLVDCTMGHVCQKADCKHRGGHVFCKMPPQAHTQDLAFDRFVPGFSPGKDLAVPGTNMGTPSIDGSAFPLPEERLVDSENEQETAAEGALIDW